jgi:hypothetical protein
MRAVILATLLSFCIVLPQSVSAEPTCELSISNENLIPDFSKSEWQRADFFKVGGHWYSFYSLSGETTLQAMSVIELSSSGLTGITVTWLEENRAFSAHFFVGVNFVKAICVEDPPLHGRQSIEYMYRRLRELAERKE